MAEIRTDRDDTLVPVSQTHPDVNLRPTAEDHLPAGHALPGGAPVVRTTPATTDDPEAVRAEIEQTRERMSGTIDEIEGVLARKKERLQERLDIMAPVRERPLPSAGVAFGVGLVVGLLTGGGDSGDNGSSLGVGALSLGAGTGASSLGDDDWEERAHMWEARARRLLRVAREQEAAIQDLEERYGTLYSRDMDLHGTGNDEAAGALGSAVTSLRDNVLGGLTDFLTSAYKQMGQGGQQHA